MPGVTRLTTFDRRRARSVPRDPIYTALPVTVATVATLAVAGAQAVVVPIAAALVWLAARLAARDADRAWIQRGALILLSARVIGVLILHQVLVAGGSAGALFLDDAGYAQVAAEIARSWRGEPPSEWGASAMGDPSIANLYVRMAAAVFWLFGDATVAVKLVNTTLAVLTAIVAYRTALNAGLPGSRVALVAVMCAPSLVLWSALALKDSYAIFFAAAAVWAATEVVRGGRLVPWLLVVAAMLLALHDVRPYVFVLLAVLLPVGLLIGVSGRRRWPAAVLGAILGFVLVVLTPAAALINPNVMGWTSFVRTQMAVGARSAFVEPPPVARGEIGQQFVVTSASCAQSSPRLVQVPPGTVIVLAGDNPYTGNRQSVEVRCGDVVQIANVDTPQVSGMSSPAASAIPAVDLRVNRVNIVATPGPVPVGRGGDDGFTFAQGIAANVAHIPVGLTFVMFAPFPLLARSWGELGAIPEMLLWYLAWPLIALALVLMVRQGRLGYTYGALMFLAIGGVLVLAEGNVGTLVRHRTMLVPFAAVLAAFGWSHVWAAWTQRRARSR